MEKVCAIRSPAIGCEALPLILLKTFGLYLLKHEIQDVAPLWLPVGFDSMLPKCILISHRN